MESRTLTLEGRIMIFKILAISKTVYLALITNYPKVIVEELQKIQKKILWKNSRPKKNIKLCLILLKPAV